MEKKAEGLKPGSKSSEFKLAGVGVAASVIAAIVPILADQVPEDSVAGLILGCLGAAAAVILGYAGMRTSAKKKELEREK